MSMSDRTISIRIDTENAAFDTDGGCEVARILRKLATEFDEGRHDADGWQEFRLHDENGNHCGTVTIL